MTNGTRTEKALKTGIVVVYRVALPEDWIKISGMERQDQPSSRDAAFRLGSLIALAASLLVSAFVTYEIVRSRGAFCGIFRDFGSEPPLVWLVFSGWYPWVLPVLSVIGIVKEWILKNRRATMIWNGIHFLAAIVVWQIYVEGAFGPIVDLFRRIGQS